MFNKLTIGDAGSMLMGAGLTKLDDLTTGLLLIGVGALLNVLVAFLQAKNIPVSASQ